MEHACVGCSKSRKRFAGVAKEEVAISRGTRGPKVRASRNIRISGNQNIGKQDPEWPAEMWPFLQGRKPLGGVLRGKRVCRVIKK